jgi:cytochrome c551/c552
MGRRSVRIGLLVAVAVLAAAQLVPVARDNPPETGALVAPPAVDALLRRACADCHSRRTVWPWYSRIAPASWLVAHDVSEGRRELDFSAWDTIDVARRRKKLQESAAEVREGEMPPWYYVLLHPAARLAPGERDTLLAWLEAERIRLAAPRR